MMIDNFLYICATFCMVVVKYYSHLSPQRPKNRPFEHTFSKKSPRRDMFQIAKVNCCMLKNKNHLSSLRATSHTMTWSGAVTMSLWGSLILVQRPYHWHGLLGFASGLLLGGGPDTISSKSRNNIYTMSCRNPSRFFIYDNIFGSLGLYLLVWSELGQSQPFSSMIDLIMQWSWAFTLVCQVAISVEVGKLARCISTLVYCYYFNYYIKGLVAQVQELWR
jgi:hypothetical protein